MSRLVYSHFITKNVNMFPVNPRRLVLSVCQPTGRLCRKFLPATLDITAFLALYFTYIA